MSGMTTSLLPESNAGLLIQAFALVASVRAELQFLLPQAQSSGNATVNGAQLQRWLASLQAAEDRLDRIVTIAIFPPPPLAVFVGQAREQIRVARQVLRSVPTTLIFPPEQATGSISRQMLEMAISALRAAERFLIQALQEA